MCSWHWLLQDVAASSVRRWKDEQGHAGLGVAACSVGLGCPSCSGLRDGVQGQAAQEALGAVAGLIPLSTT